MQGKLFSVTDSDPNPVIVKPDPFAALRYKEFRSFLGMRFFFTLAYQMQAVVIGYHIYDLTHDALKLGLVGLCEAIPAIGIALYGGYIADKSEKRGLLIKIFTGVWLASVLMLIMTSKYLHLKEDIIVLIMYGLVFCIGIARGFFGPATFSLMAKIVPKELYPNSATWNSSSWQLATIIGPVAGGFVNYLWGITAAYGFIVVLVSISLICIFNFKKHPSTYVPKENIFHSLKEGIQFVFKTKMMVWAMSLDLFSVFFGGAVALLPMFAKDVFHLGSYGLGMMRGAASLGAVVTMLAMTRFSPMGRPWRNLLIAVTGFGLSIICYGLSKNFYLTLFFLFLEGSFDSVSVIIRQTIMQLLTPDEMRGRVSAVNSMFIGSSNEIGEFESGLSAKLLTLVPAVVFGGSMTIAIAGITWLKTRSLTKLSLQDINEQTTKPV
ncbi:Predicted arabinose efflux permease, MFS family [Pedobacter soli]|uniref:Predicted arabinose efflux permease, MFS family n=1 Tax=Pedobacter soli TaxID=390242 RepID=A0A1G6UCY7_9SPHI|nr:Predicted arabinose efflux permease, MFS family [Pedobacter soli]